MTISLRNRRHTCGELGVCQRTGAECRKACHIATAEEAPIGYEAARTAQLYDFPSYNEWRNQTHTPSATGPQNRDEAIDAANSDQLWLRSLVLRASIAVLSTIALLGLVGYSMAMPDSWLHDAMDWISAAYWRSLHLLA